MTTNPGQEGARFPQEGGTQEGGAQEGGAHGGAHADPGIKQFFFGRVPAGVHGGLKQYSVLAIFLAVVTLIEFVIILPENLQGAAVSLAPLIILSVIKFFCVVAFFMHLKFEHPLLWQIFVAGLALGLVVALSLVLLFGVFRPTPRAFTDGRAEPFVHHPVEEKPHYEPLVVPTPAPPGAALPAAGTGGAAGGGDNPGLALFTGRGGCTACHTVEGVSQGILGPDLTGIASVAGSRVAEQSAEEYLRISIADPDAYTAGAADGLSQDYQAGLMMATLAGINLTDEEIDILVEYLLTLR